MSHSRQRPPCIHPKSIPAMQSLRVLAFSPQRRTTYRRSTCSFYPKLAQDTKFSRRQLPSQVKWHTKSINSYI